MTPSLVIGIDSSTTGCKAIAWDCAGRAAAESRVSYPLLQPRPNWYEQDADEWWHGACTALNELLDKVDASQVDALCITHQRESFVPVDDHGCPIRNAILWMDERSYEQVGFLKNAIGSNDFHRITGKPLTTNPSVTKIVWLMQRQPEVLAQARKLLDAHAFLIYHLTGAFRTSLASADPMGLVDMEAHAWSSDVIKETGLRSELLPELVPPGEIIGYVSDSAAAMTHLPAGLPVVAGAGDGQCAGLGVNATSGNRASLNLGTAVVSGSIRAGYLTDPAFRTLYAPIAGLYFLETVIQSGAFTVAWFLDEFASEIRDGRFPSGPEEQMERAAADIPPGSLGLMLVPYWNHAMTPYWDPAATGITIGWTGAHGRAHFYRAILEGVAFEQRLVSDALGAATQRAFTEYVALGGGSRSSLWCQILADVTGRSIVRSATTEATCLGAGILAATAAGWFSDAYQAAKGMARVTDHFLPDAVSQAIYEPLFNDVYKPLYPTVRPLIRRLASLTHTSH